MSFKITEQSSLRKKLGRGDINFSGRTLFGLLLKRFETENETELPKILAGKILKFL